MSVSSESRKGDRIYVIEGFLAKPFIDDDGLLDSSKSKELDTGDSVTFLDWSLEAVRDNLEYFIHYTDNTGEELKAVESYFVTEEVWNGLRDYFTKILCS